LQDLVGFLNDLHSVGIDLFLHQQGVDTTTNGGTALYQMMGVFAEFERALIRERIMAGLERAKAQGTKLGRRSIDGEKEAAIRKDLRAGKVGMIKLAKAHGVGLGLCRGSRRPCYYALNPHKECGHRQGVSVCALRSGRRDARPAGGLAASAR
jgi:DNA invertase Pin-like site-specific DNA recombinase